MQGTVLTFDATTGDGTVLLDDGAVMGFGGAAMAGSGLRLLRRGQRVRLLTEATEADPRIVGVRLPSPG